MSIQTDKLMTLEDGQLLYNDLRTRDDPYGYIDTAAAVMSFNDGAEGVPLKELEFEVKPVQDLHGYDKPWPAGGGKNLLIAKDTSKNETGFTATPNKDNDGNIIDYTITRTTASTWRSFVPYEYPIKDVDVTYKVHYYKKPTNATIYAYDDTSSANAPLYSNTYGATITVPANHRVIGGIYFNGDTTASNEKLQMTCTDTSVSDDATFEPYSNICPISGWIGAKVTRTGFNVWNGKGADNLGGSISGGTYTDNNSFVTNYVPVVEGATYYFNSTNWRNWVNFYSENNYNSFISQSTFGANGLLTIPTGAKYIRATGILANKSTACINLHDSARDGQYAPYSGTEYTLTFPASAGTVYGGTVKVNSDGTGTLVVNRAIVDLGSLTWVYNSNNGKFASSDIATLVKKPSSTSIKPEVFTSIGHTVLSPIVYNTANGYLNITIDESNGNIGIHDPFYTNTSTFKTAMNDVQLCYELATPIMYDLSPVEVTTLLGINNIWAGTGNILSLTYAKDIPINYDINRLGQILNGYRQIKGNSDLYTFRRTDPLAYGCEYCEEKLIGGTFVWNQLVQNGNFANSSYWNAYSGSVSISNNEATITTTGQYGQIAGNTFYFVSGHKYLFSFEGKSSDGLSVGIGNSSFSPSYPSRILTSSYARYSEIRSASSSALKSAVITAVDGGSNKTFSVKNVNCFDLTQMFGSTIADVLYAMGDAGVAWFRERFPKDYYAYDAGSLQSVQAASKVMRGFNQWDEQWEYGNYDTSTGQKSEYVNMIRSKNYIPIIPSLQYYISSTNCRFFFYDASFNYIGTETNNPATAPSNAYYMNFHKGSISTAYQHDICINISDPVKNGTYEPYVEHAYPFDTSITLRGIPKLDNNNRLYYDGDEYESSGKVTRKYGIVDLGTLNWSVMQGTVAGSATGEFGFFRTDSILSGAKKHSQNSNAYNYGICTKFTTNESPYNIFIGQDTGNNICVDAGGQVRVSRKDNSMDGSAFKTAMSGVYFVYELVTPITENVDPYYATMKVDPNGTEEFVDAGVNASEPTRDVSIPVGHETTYLGKDLGETRYRIAELKTQILALHAD